MTISRDAIILVVGGIVALLLQVIVAPYISFMNAIPNFVLVFALAFSVVRPDSDMALSAFLLGLGYSLFCGGPVGFMSILIIVATLVVTRVFVVLSNASLFMPFMLIAMAALVVETIVGISATSLADVSVFEAVLFRSIPCALYDSIIGLIFYPILTRVAASKSTSDPLESPRLI